jgi:glycerophosphoryl diester phosphodiesterase
MKKQCTPLLAAALLSVMTYSVHAQTIIAHRGLFLQPGQELPENTLQAVEHAYNVGYRSVEVDVRVSSDGVAYLMHDNAVNPQTGADSNFAGFSPQRTTDYDGYPGVEPYTPYQFAYSGTGNVGILERISLGYSS